MQFPKPKKIKIVGDIILLLLGFHFFTQIYLGIYENSNPSFLSWLRFFGLIIFLHGTMSLIRIFLLYHKPVWDKTFFISRKFLEVALVPMLFILRSNVSIIPIIKFEGNNVYLVKTNEANNEVAFWILTLIIIGVIGNLFYTIYQYFLAREEVLMEEVDN